MIINGCSFKYVCVEYCLKIRFYCFAFSAISNLNSAGFTTSNQSSEILILKIEMLLKFQNNRNGEIIGFQLMHFGFALELSDIDLSNIDLLDTHLDLLDEDIPSKYFLCLHSVFKTCLQDMSSRRLQCNNFSPRRLCNTSSRRLGRRKIVILKTCWRRLQHVFKTNTNVCWDRNTEKVTRLPNVQKKIDNFFRKHFLKNNNETNKQEQNISLNPKKNLCMERPLK